jgi:hypothetical protein
VIEQLAKGRRFGFSLERAVFASVMRRLVVSGSDRACETWLDAYHIEAAEGLQLHQLYRAMAWLGENSPNKPGQPGRRVASRISSKRCCSNADAAC